VHIPKFLGKVLTQDVGSCTLYIFVNFAALFFTAAFFSGLEAIPAFDQNYYVMLYNGKARQNWLSWKYIKIQHSTQHN
jgi:hypothetical protein